MNFNLKNTLPVFVLIVLFNILSINLLGQNVQISGYVSDRASGEKLIGATVFDKQSKKGTASNAFGFFSFSIKGSAQLTFSYVGYESFELSIDKLTQDTTLNISLTAQALIDEIVIAASDERINKGIGMLHLTPKVVSKVNGFMGEPDVLKAYQLMPGVQNGTEGFSGMYVRGGGSDQNLILLDDVPIYNASHLFGMFSIFNNSIINNSTMVKGGGEAIYGGRLSSILDVRMKEGNQHKLSGDLSVSNIAASFHINGPMGNKFRYSLAFRRTYVDAFSMLIQKVKHPEYSKYYDMVYFYDLNGKFSYQLNDKNKFSLSSYYGKDKYDRVREKEDSVRLMDNSKVQWGNFLLSGHWLSQLYEKTIMKTTLAYGNYQFSNAMNYERESASAYEKTNQSLFSGVSNGVAKVDFENFTLPNHDVKWGTSLISYQFQPEALSTSNSDTLVLDTVINDFKIKANELALYVQDGMSIGNRLRFNVGMRFSAFNTHKQWFSTWEPRVSTKYTFSKNVSAQASLYRTAQYVFLLSNGSVGLPTDLWLPMTNRQVPQNANQVELGINASFFEQFRFSVEAYYKEMEGLMEFKDGELTTANDINWDAKTEQGTGVAKGLEFLLTKSSGKTTGWIAYTLSSSDRSFPTINNGQPFPFKFSRTHDLSIVVQQVLSAKLTLNLTWVYNSGQRITLPIQKYLNVYNGLGFDNGKGIQVTNSGYLFEYGERNAEKLPAYHRLDINLQYQFKEGSPHTWQFGLYNAYNRANPYYYYSRKYSGETQFVQASLFGIIPFISYAYEF